MVISGVKHLVNLTGATIIVAGKTMYPKLGPSTRTRNGGIAKFPLNFWSLALKDNPDEKGFAPYKRDKKGLIILDETLCPREEGTVYVVNEAVAKLFCYREDYVLFVPDKPVIWRNYRGETLTGRFGKEEKRVLEVLFEFEEDVIPEPEEAVVISEEVGANGLGNLAEALDSALAGHELPEEQVEEEPTKESEAETVEEVEKSKKTPVKKASTRKKKVEVEAAEAEKPKKTSSRKKKVEETTEEEVAE